MRIVIMVKKRSAAAARTAAREKILKKYESTINALAEFERANPEQRREAIIAERDRAVQKAHTKYNHDIEQLNLELAPIIANLRGSLTPTEVREHTGLSSSEQVELVKLLDTDGSHDNAHGDVYDEAEEHSTERTTDDSSENHAGVSVDDPIG